MLLAFHHDYAQVSTHNIRLRDLGMTSQSLHLWPLVTETKTCLFTWEIVRWREVVIQRNAKCWVKVLPPLSHVHI